MPAGILEVICLTVERKTRRRVDVGSGFGKSFLRLITRSSRHRCGDASLHDGRDRYP